MMLTSRLRNGKVRVLSSMILCVALIVIFCLLRDVHIKLNEARETAEKCHQKHESLAAQLQVMSEHKTRLDKSLQFEIQQHKKTKEDLQSHYQQIHDKERKEASNRLNSLQQQYKMLQTQVEDLQDESQKLQQSNNNLIEEKQQLNNKLAEQLQAQKLTEKQLDEFKISVSNCKMQLETVNGEMYNVKFNLGKTQEQLATCRSDHWKSKTNESFSSSKTSPLNDIKILQLNKDKVNDKKQEKIKSDILNKAREKKSANNIDEIKLPRNDDIDIKPNDEALQQLAPPNPPIVNQETLNLNRKPEEDEEANRGIQEEFRGNGLEQQENGEDQDLDNMEDEEGEGAGAVNRKDEGKVFEDADFDQIEDGIKPLPLKPGDAQFENEFH